MHKLLSFHPCPDLSFQGDMAWSGDFLHFQWSAKDPKQILLDGFEAGARKPNSLVRKNGLWQTTCFEAFWAIPKEKGYWELNLSGAGEWNLYHFDDYRIPQPPRECEDFSISGWNCTVDSLHCTLSLKMKLPALQASLCAIARTDQQTYYFSTKHAGEKPDFHLRESFRLPVERHG